MEKKTISISMSQLVKNTEQIVNDIETSGTVYSIKQPGHKTMLLMDKDYFESWVVTVEFMTDHPNWKEELEQSEREYKAGLFIPWDQVRKELGLDEPRRQTKRRRPARRASGSSQKARR